MKTKWYLKATTDNLRPPIACTRLKYKIGEWMPKRRISLCSSGWHVTDMENIHRFSRYNSRLFVCVARGKSEDGNYKSVHEQIKLVFEIREGEFDAHFKKKYLAKIKNSGLFTPKAIRLYNALDWRMRETIERYFGAYYSTNVCSELRDNAEFRKHFARFVNRKLRELGYD